MLTTFRKTRDHPLTLGNSFDNDPQIIMKILYNISLRASIQFFCLIKPTNSNNIIISFKRLFTCLLWHLSSCESCFFFENEVVYLR